MTEWEVQLMHKGLKKFCVGSDFAVLWLSFFTSTTDTGVFTSEGGRHSSCCLKTFYKKQLISLSPFLFVIDGDLLTGMNGLEAGHTHSASPHLLSVSVGMWHPTLSPDVCSLAKVGEW